MRPSPPVASRPAPGQPLVLDSPDFSADLNDLVDRFSRFSRRIASRHGLDATEVDEVLQDLRIRLWRAAASPGGVRFPNSSYVYKTVVSASLDAVRRRRTQHARAVDLEAVSPGDVAVAAPVEARLDGVALASLVHEELDRLGSTRRQAVQLYLSGHDRFDIARVTGWSLARARNLLYRGLADLRRALVTRGVVPRAFSRTSQELARPVHSAPPRSADHLARPTIAA